ncbi:MAG: hypothetical protein WD844_04600 [Thermoleophilaceae bacterium]
MLAITTAAADAIKAIVSSSEDVPEDGGLRIAATASADSGGTALAVELAEEPAAGDQVVDEDGAHVFLEPQAAVALDAAVLDAEVEGGAVSFAIGQQPGDPPPAV